MGNRDKNERRSMGFGSVAKTLDAAEAVETALPDEFEPTEDGKDYRVWYGTHRKPILKNGKLAGYSPFRDDKVHYGRCIVRVPTSHKFGETGSTGAIAGIRRFFSGKDDRLTLEQIAEVQSKLFWSSVAKQVAEARPGKRDLVVFIHGYNVSFEDAALRSAQLACDLSIEGAMAFYCWPSRGTLQGYPADEATIGPSAQYITDFLSTIAVKAKAEAVHVIVHSMGNRAALEAVRRIVTAAGKKSSKIFTQFILAAPDVDVDDFKEFANNYRFTAKRTTMYVSDHDRAVAASRWLHDYDRVGLAPPFQIVEGIDTIYAGYIDDSFLGHGYVAEAEWLLNDIHQLIHLDADPGDRTSVKRSKSGTYWELAKHR